MAMHTPRFKGLIKELEAEAKGLRMQAVYLDSVIKVLGAVRSPRPLVGKTLKVAGYGKQEARPSLAPARRNKRRYQITCSTPADMCPRGGKPFLSALPPGRHTTKDSGNRYCHNRCGANHRRWLRTRAPQGGRKRPVTLIQGDQLKP
jgi:hypothetical protein